MRVHTSAEYTEKACGNCGEESTTKIVMRGFVFYLCWGCSVNLTEDLYKEIKL
jgi:hypothetical protein